MPSRAASRLSRAKRVRRHKEGGGRAPGPAKRAAVPVHQPVDQQGQDQLGQDAGARQLRVLGRQLGEPELALQPLEGELDLPAQAVEGHDPLDRPGRGLERGQQHQPVGRAPLLERGGAAAFPRLLVDARPALGSTAGGPAHEDQPARVPASPGPGNSTGRSSRSGRPGRRSTPFRVTRAPLGSRSALLLSP